MLSRVFGIEIDQHQSDVSGQYVSVIVDPTEQMDSKANVEEHNSPIPLAKRVSALGIAAGLLDSEDI